MTNTELKRDHEGKLHLYVNGAPALGVKFTGMQAVGDENVAFFAVPLKTSTIGEVANVVPFVRPVFETR